MIDYNPTEAQRLIAALREDDARMTSGTWTVDEWGALGIRVDGKSAGISSMGSRPDAAAIARTRNNLPALADQLEAAGREVERLTGERDRVVAHGHEMIAERDSLRACIESEIHAHAASCARELAVTRERDALRQQLEATHAANEVEQYNPTEAQRLIAEAREQYRHEDKHGVHVRAGTLLSLADQLEAAQRELRASTAGSTAAREDDERVAQHVEQLENDELSAQLVACSFERRSMDAERDLAAAQRRIADADAELADRNREHAIDRDTAVRHAREDAQIARQERDLAQRRIAELEDYQREYANAALLLNSRHVPLQINGRQIAMDARIAWLISNHDKTESALRATYPVYRAAEAWAKESELVKAGVGGSIDRCFELEKQTEDGLVTARAALTSEIRAALDRAGLERDK